MFGVWMIAILLALHLAFFSPFLLRLLGLIGRAGARGAGPITDETHSDPRADALLVLHGATFAIFYWGLFSELAGNRAPRAGAGAAVSGALLLVLASGLLTWSLWVFRSWRLLAELDRGHELCTRGPFCWVSHHIYLACDLLWNTQGLGGSGTGGPWRRPPGSRRRARSSRRLRRALPRLHQAHESVDSRSLLRRAAQTSDDSPAPF